MNYLKRIIGTLLILLGVVNTYAYNLRQISNADGLSNSAILSLYQDQTGLVWFGTYDGLNLYDGVNVTPFTPFGNQNLAGNIIEHIVETEDGVLWLLTNYGLNRIDKYQRSVTSYPGSQGGYFLCKNERNDVFVLFRDNTLHYIMGQNDELHELINPSRPWTEIFALYAGEGYLYTFTRQGMFRYPLVLTPEQTYALGKEEFIEDMQISYAFTEGQTAYLLDRTSTLYEYDIVHHRRTRITTLEDDIFRRRGGLADIIRNGNNYFIAYKTDGVVKLAPEGDGFRAEDLGIKSGMFRLMKDRYQNIIWMGTDSQGVYIYSEENYSIQSVTYQDLNVNIGKPVRSIFLDKDNTLWLGTKGEGILKIFDYDIRQKTTDYRTEQVLAQNSSLTDNSVFAFAPSSRPLFWIGTDLGLNYYSYAERRIKRVPGCEDVIYIHDLYEEGDSVLWMATVGTGIVRARIEGSPNEPRLTQMKRYTIDNANLSSNYFFTLCPDGEGGLLFGNRGYGVFRIENDTLMSLPMRHQYASQTVNDIFSIVKTDSTLWLGSSYGLIKQTSAEEQCFSRDNGFVNSAIHTLLPDNQRCLWIATNRGLVRFHTDNNEYQPYHLQNGLKIIEFTDGASLRTDKGLLFGGINGIAVICEDTPETTASEYMPPIHFTRLSILGHEEHLYQYLQKKEERQTLWLNHDQSSFSIYFVAPDYINANSYTYLYKIGKETQWIDNGDVHSVSFNQMAAGDYTLHVKYRNRITGKESPVYSLHIHIQPPWYLSNAALWTYQVIVLLLIVAAVRILVARQRRKQAQAMAQLEHAHREEVYEEKLRFFTNITHEFCTPLTLIYGPCERILAHASTDEFTRKYVHLIKWNAERLNTLIQEVIDFRRMETGHKERNIQPTCVSQTCRNLITSFAELAEQNQVSLETGIEPDLYWNTDESCFTKIINNLVSNAFKYTPSGGNVRICLKQEQQHLHFSVYNTGKGIKQEDMKRIFNRYSVLDSIEENAVKGISSRNGLGMAICHSMVELLDGHIGIESEVGQYARFIVTLPQLEVSKKKAEAGQPAPVPTEPLPAPTDTPNPIDQFPAAAEKPEDSKEKVRILAIDDNAEILALLQESLSERYRVTTAHTGEEGLEILKKETPELIITDIMMPGTDGIELTRQIKSNRHTMHIPLIILSARASNDEKIEGLESGADAYIEKPFNINYLIATADRLIANRSQMREYYNSSACAYDFANGQLMQKEDKEFLQSVIEYIDQHMENSDLSPDDLAIHLQISTRKLFRKFQELNQLSPKDFIKEQKMNFAAKLLRTTTLTIQEIIFQSGFTNRAHFYREFSKRFQHTPKDYRNLHQQKDSSLNSSPATESD